MIQFSYQFSRLLSFLNVILCFAFLVVGTTVHAFLFGASALAMFATSRMFARMEELEKIRRKQMHNTGDNDYDMNAEDEYEVFVDED